MIRRMLVKATLVAAMGFAALATPERVQASSQQPCYTCYDSGGECPDEATHAQICESVMGELCPMPSECVWATAECPSSSQVRLTCGPRQ
ncbi:MAG: hypothetical protein KY444_06215 [Gemmatimonadetes bacterium]|nr:hypothetical protein [Gemmatimonadota bacterium]